MPVSRSGVETVSASSPASDADDGQGSIAVLPTAAVALRNRDAGIPTATTAISSI